MMLYRRNPDEFDLQGCISDYDKWSALRSYLAANAKVDEIQCIYLHEVLQDLLTVATDAVGTLEDRAVEVVPIHARRRRSKDAVKEQVSQKFKQSLGLLHFCFAMRGVSMPFHLLSVDAAKRTSAFKARCGIGRRAVRSSQFWALLSPGCCTCAPCRKLWRGAPGLLAFTSSRCGNSREASERRVVLEALAHKGGSFPLHRCRRRTAT